MNVGSIPTLVIMEQKAGAKWADSLVAPHCQKDKTIFLKHSKVLLGKKNVNHCFFFLDEVLRI